MSESDQSEFTKALDQVVLVLGQMIDLIRGTNENIVREQKLTLNMINVVCAIIEKDVGGEPKEKTIEALSSLRELLNESSLQSERQLEFLSRQPGT